MTKQTKIIIGVVGGLVLIGGFVVIAVAAVIGLSVMAAQSDETTNKAKDKKSAVTRDKNGNPKQKSKSAKDADEDKDGRKSKDDNEEDGGRNGAESLNGSLAPELVGKWVWSDGSRH